MEYPLEGFTAVILSVFGISLLIKITPEESLHWISFKRTILRPNEQISRSYTAGYCGSKLTIPLSSRVVLAKMT